MEKRKRMSGTIIALNFKDNEVVIKLNSKYEVEKLQDVCYNEEEVSILI